MQVEISLPNRDGSLLPGAFVQVALPLQASGALTVPTNVLLFRPEGPRVAAVDAEGRVSLRAVRIGRNYGEAIEVLDGIAGTDQLVLNPSDSLNDGDQVAIAAAPAKDEKKEARKDAKK
jgi:hypothetical protein